MVKLADLKKGLSPLKKAKEQTSKQVTVEIDLEKAACALLNEPVQGIEKADDNTDADELAKSLGDRVDAISALLEKGEEDDDGRVFVTVDANDEIAKEFSVEKGFGRKKPKMAEDADAEKGDEGSETDTAKADTDPDTIWERDLAGTASKVRKLTKSEQPVSTDPSERKRINKAKRDRVRERRAERSTQ